MKMKLGCLFFLLLFLLSDISGHNLEDKRVHKKNISHAAPRSLSLVNLSINLNSFLQKNGLTAVSATSSPAPGQIMRSLFLQRPGSQDSLRNIYWNNESGTPRYIEINSNSNRKAGKTANKLSMAESAENFLLENKSLLRIKDPKNEFQLISQKTDQLNTSHLKFMQTYKGLEVWAKEIIVHLDRNGSITAMNGTYEPTPEAITDTNGNVSSSMALEKAMSDIQRKTTATGLPSELAKIINYSGPVLKKIIWHNRNHVPHLAWFVEIRADIAQDWYYFIDANSGEILHSYNNVNFDGPETGSANDLNGVKRTFPVYQFDNGYILADASEPMYNIEQSTVPDGMIGAIITLDLKHKDYNSPIYYITSTANEWTDPAAVSAHYNAIVSYKYFLNFFKRNSIDDNGMTIRTIVHVTEDGQSMENAFWFGKVICFGDGGRFFKPLAGALDVTAHEMGHGITQYSAGLEYQDQSGALNDSYSDVFAAMVDSLNWQMAESVIRNHQVFPSGCLRDMADPHNGSQKGSEGWQPANMSEFVETDMDNGGVHINSGIPNHAFYHAAQSLGRPDAGRIWYRALTLYLTRSSQFTDACIATEKAAIDLFGENSNQLQQVKNAWDAVGVNDGGTPPPPPSTIEGAEWILITNTSPSDPNSLYMAKTTINSSSDYFALSQTPVANRPAVSDATGLVIFVDMQHNLRVLLADPKNPQETILDSSGVWGSVAIGPGLTSLALTSMFQDTTIYYIDLINNTYKAFKIATKSYDAPDAKTALYADALSFEPSGNFLLFDAYNELSNATGSKISFWNINKLNVKTGYMDAVLPPQSEGISVANPSYSKTSTTRFTFDLIDAKKKQDYVLAADFNTGNVATVAGPLSVLGYPTYSANDRTIAFHTAGTVSGAAHDIVAQVPLKSNCLEPGGPVKDYAVDATYPTWFVIGKRAVSSLAGVEARPEGFMLMQNFPNPFNPSSSISFMVPQTGLVQLKIYDILGKEIATLVNEVKAPGSYTVSFNSQELSLPSGIYLYRLSQGQKSASRKMILIK